MLAKFAPILLLVTSVIGRALPESAETEELLAWPNPSADLGGWHFNVTNLSKRSGEMVTTLPDGNECDIRVSAGSGTQDWTPQDFANLYGHAGNVLTSSISRNNRAQVGLTTSFTDHTGRSHQVDCEVTVTGASPVSIAGAYQNVDQALVAAEHLADSSWTGLIGTARSTLRIFFGNVVAISIAVNVLN